MNSAGGGKLVAHFRTDWGCTYRLSAVPATEDGDKSEEEAHLLAETVDQYRAAYINNTSKSSGLSARSTIS